MRERERVSEREREREGGLNQDALKCGNFDQQDTFCMLCLCTLQPLKSGHLTNQDTSLIRTPH